MHRSLIALVCAGVLAGAGACTDDSHQKPVTPPEVGQPDVTPPTVVDRLPPAGSRSGYSIDGFHVTFSEPLDPRTVNADTVRIWQDGLRIDSLVALSGDGLVVTITPSLSLAVPGTVRVELTSGIADRAGNAFVVEQIPWTFDLVAWEQLGPAEGISTGTGANPSPSIALDADGNIVVGMGNIEGPDYVVRFRNGAWEAINPVFFTISGRILADAEGGIWMVDDDFSDQLYVRHLEPSGGWSTVSHASASAGAYPWYESYVPRTENPVLIWNQCQPNGGDRCVVSLRFAVRDSAGRWVNPQAVEGDINRFDAAAAPSGDVFVVGNTWARVQVFHLPPGPSAEGEPVMQLPDPSQGEPCRTTSEGSIGIGKDGQPIVAFTCGGYGLMVKRWDGGAWIGMGGSLRMVETASADFSDLAVDLEGRTVVAWGERAPGSETRLIYVARWTGSAWQTIGGPLNVDQSHDAYAVALALDAAGMPVVAWPEYTGGVELDANGNPYDLYRFQVKRMTR